MGAGAMIPARIRSGIRRSVPGASVVAVVGSVVQWWDGNSEAPLRLVALPSTVSRGGGRPMRGRPDAPCGVARRGDEPLPAPNARQMEEIEVTVALFDANREVELIDWEVIDPSGFLRDGRQPQGIYVHFLYRRADDEDPEPLPGHEVTVFGEDGSVLDSQDVG